MMEAVMDDELLEKLRGLKSWRDYEERVEKRGEARAEAKAEEIMARAEASIAQAEENARRAVAAAKADALTQFFYMRGDKPSRHALAEITECTDVNQLNLWLRQAYAGETSAEIFPEPKA